VRHNRVEHPYQAWSTDFQFDDTADGRTLKFLNVINKHSRRCLAMRVGRCCRTKDMLAVVDEMTSVHLAPTSIWSHNGPKFISQALRD
jgi:putative transposase